MSKTNTKTAKRRVRIRPRATAARPAMSILFAFMLCISLVPTQALATLSQGDQSDDVPAVVANDAEGGTSGGQGGEPSGDSGENGDSAGDGAAATTNDEGDGDGAAGGGSDGSTSKGGSAGSSDNADKATSGSSAKKSDSADDANATGDAEFLTTTDDADNTLTAITLLGEDATKSKAAATSALAGQTDATDAQAAQAAAALFSAPTGTLDTAKSDGEALEPNGDGSNVDKITAVWITQDTTDNGDDDLLYLKPSGDETLSVVGRVAYSLSGEHDYEAGTVQITIPAHIFQTRDGKDAGTMLLPFPEDPDTRANWNYRLVGDEYVITNTHTLSAATQGFFEFSITGLTPHQIVDMQETAPFDATIEVTTHKGNLIGAKSNSLTAQIDTEAVIEHATKKANSVTIVDSSQIPAAQRIDGEESYVLVTWYMNPYSSSINQPYKLELTDTITSDDPSVENAFVGDGYTGFIVDATAEDEQSKTVDVSNGYTYSSLAGGGRYTTVKVAYPTSQFDDMLEKQKEEDEAAGKDPTDSVVNLTFKNKVTYTLAEQDETVGTEGEAGYDEQKVTTAVATAQTSFEYRDPKFVDPEGHFNIWKYGNSSVEVPYGYGYETRHSSDRRGNDIGMTTGEYYGNNGYYGYYPSILNKMANGEDAHISYTIDSVGYTLPWTLGDGLDAKVLDNYGKKDVTMTTEDRGLTLDGDSGDALTLGIDYVYESVEFPKKPVIQKATAINLDDDGNFTSWDDGTVDYEVDTDDSNIPDIMLQIQRGGSWKDYATVSWSSGSLEITMVDGSAWDGSSVVAVPEGTENVRTAVTTKIAGINYYIRVNVALDADGAVGSKAKELLADKSNTAPSLQVWNHANMTPSQGGKALFDIDKAGYDMLRGYQTDTRATLSKSSNQSIAEVDYGAKTAIVHYSAALEKQSFISEYADYQEAVESGALLTEQSGTWYDLLPEGMSPDLSTVRLRANDVIQQVYTIENYHDSGRTLLVVKAKLTPQATTYDQGDFRYYMDKITLSFDATYSFQAIEDLGSNTHNVVAFESDNDYLGSVGGYEGEKNDPYGSNNYGTASAFANDEERDAMRNLGDDGRTDPSFVYAGCYQDVSLLAQAETGLYKLVSVNNDGYWSSGIEEKDDESLARDVYEGGAYTYRLTMMSDIGTTTSNVILYDSLENFKAADGNEDNDIAKPTWQGALQRIDVSQLEDAGCAPVIYYSTVKGLQLGEDAAPVEKNVDLSNTEVWSTTPPHDLSDVTAVAIDASKRADGGDFILGEGEHLSVYLHMLAPSGEAAANLIEEDAHAYNNVHMSATSTNAATGRSEDNFIRKDYTKVGLSENNITVAKAWSDDGNRDGKRPDSVTVRLLADGQDTGEKLTLSADNDWQDAFEHLAYMHDDGTKIIYSVEEDAIDGYEGSLQVSETDSGFTYTFTNAHTPEKTSVAGVKTWVNDTKDVRPDRITVNLYADGEFLKSQTVTPDDQGEWSYEFTDLNKYRDGGTEIEYTVKEQTGSAGDAYIPTVDEDGTTLVNTYHPYGDLTFTKQVEDATEVNADKAFTFELTFLQPAEEGQDAEPNLDAFDYDVLNADDEVVSSGTIATGGTIELEAGQTAHVKELPQGTTYTIVEQGEGGFSQTGAVGSEGTIAPNDTVEAAFTNRYAASTTVNLEANKTLTGRELTNYQFRFELLDEDGNVVRTAYSGRPDNTETATDGAITSTAAVTFGALSYTQADHGKTYTYTMREVATDKAGYTYSQDVYKATVTLADNGDGTMTPTVQYFDENDDLLDVGAVPTFKNSYEASGSFSPQAHKELTGGDLKDGQFTFEIGEVTLSDDGATTTIEWLTDEGGNKITATNTVEGVIDFPEISYNQNQMGEHIYAIHEVAGDDATITYDAHYSIMRVTVTDNGDGTLSASSALTGESIPCFVCGGTGTLQDGSDCAACEGGQIAMEADSYVFQNAYLPGGLDVKKTIADDSEGGDPNQMFKFRVELTNEEGQPVEVDPTSVTVDPLNDEGSGAAEAAALDAADPADDTASATTVEDEPSVPSVPLSVNAAVSADLGVAVNDLSRNAEAAVAAAQATMAAAKAAAAPQAVGDPAPTAAGDTTQFAVYSADDQSLRFYNQETAPTEGYMFEGRTATAVYTTLSGSSWSSRARSIKAVVVEDEGIAPASMQSWFSGFRNCTSIDLAKLDTSNATNMSYMFDGCSSLESLDVSGFDTSKATNMSYMFYGCSSLESLDVSGFDTSRVMNMSHMFQSCSSLASLDVSGFNTSNATNMSSMFYGCYSLEPLDVSGFDTSKVTDMSYMFGGCSSLESLDLTSFDTSNVTEMNGMFGGCSKLASLDVSGFDTSSVTNVASMFFNCSSLTSLDLTSFDTSNVENMFNMFAGCSSLTSLDLKSFSTSNVTSMGEMFKGCSFLATLNLSSFNTSNATNMSCMFDDCQVLSSVEFGSDFEFKDNTTLPRSQTPNTHWVRLDSDGSPVEGASMSAGELAELSKSATGLPAGTYVWDWTVNVVFNANGASGTMGLQSWFASPGSSLTLPECSLYQYGYRFLGWKYGNGSELIADGATVDRSVFENSSGNITSDTITLVAQWEKAFDINKPSEGVLEIEMPGNYIAHISNALPSGTSYKVYEETPSGWVLVNSSDTTGTIVPTETQTAAFVNKYSPNTVSAQLRATKTLDGAWASAANGFEFKLTETARPDGVDAAETQTAKATDGGAVTFEPITYTKAGTYTYEIAEVAGSNSGIEYDATTHTATVTVTDDGQGNLSAAVVYDGDESVTAPAFANTTKPGSLSITKTATGALSDASSAQAFTFQVTIAGKAYSGAYIVGGETLETTDGTISLTAGQTALIDGLAAGASYAVSEIDIPAGWTLERSSGTSGTITSDTTAQVSFANAYAASEGTAQLMAYKSFDGATLAGGEFSFELLDEKGDVIETAQNGPTDPSLEVAGGSNTAPVYFTELSYTEPGVHTYTIREVVPDDAVNPNVGGTAYKVATDEQRLVAGWTYDGVIYDVEPRTATVTVEDVGTGELKTTVEYAATTSDSVGNVFANTAQLVKLHIVKRSTGTVSPVAADATFTFDVSLVDASGDPLEGEYAYTVQDEEGTGQDVGSGTISNGGSISLKVGWTAAIVGLPYGTAYSVTERAPSAGWTQATGDDAIAAGAASTPEEQMGTLTGDTTVTIANTYTATGSATIEASKQLNGSAPADGQFTFKLSEEGGAELQRATNDGEGTVTFEPIEYTADMLEGKTTKDFVYEVSEVAGNDYSVSYDEHVAKVTVTVTDNGDGTLSTSVAHDPDDGSIFENFTSVVLPRTGGAGVGLAGVAVLAVGLAAYLIRRRRA